MRIRRPFRLTVSVLTLATLAASLLTSASAATRAGAVTLAQPAPAPQAGLVVRASGFTEGESISAVVDGAAVGTVKAGANGSVAGLVGRVPDATPIGTHQLVLTGGTSGTVASASFATTQSAPQVTNDFPQWRYNDEKTGVNPTETVLGPSNVSQLVMKWKGHAYFGAEPPLFKGRRISGSPIVAGGLVFITSYDGRLYAFPTSCSNPCIPAWTTDTLGTLIQGTAAVKDGVVYVGSRVNLDETAGNVWAFPTACSTPCQPLWRSDTTGSVDTGILVQNGRVYVTDDSGTLNVYPAACTTPCQPIWYGHPNGVNEFDSSPAIADGRVWVGSSLGKVYAWTLSKCTTGLCAVDWSYRLETDTHTRYIDVTPAIKNHVMYIANFKPTVAAFPTNCAGPCPPTWSGTTVKHGRIESSPAVTDDAAYFGSIDGVVHKFDTACVGTSCNETGTMPAGSHVPGSPTIANGLLYVGSQNSYIYAFPVPCGQEPCQPVWSLKMGNKGVYSSAAVVNGTVYIAANNGWLYALGLP
jgi:outer membrane protein assembly factor BamB